MRIESDATARGVATTALLIAITLGRITLATAAEADAKKEATDSPDRRHDVPHFESDVRPIFKAMCFQCHGEEDELAGGLDVRLARLIREGGDSGEAIIDADPGQSVLWERIESDEMPEGAKKLTDSQKETIRKWILAGSPTLRDEPEDVEDAKYTEEELQFWAFRPVAPVAPPRSTEDVDDNSPIYNPIDAFVRSKLREVGLHPSPPADRETLLRRVTFDLTGLPPTPTERSDFLKDGSPEAYEKVVDRLLGSDQFGVRWGRHWLDIAGYSETHGHLADDILRPHAWRYRDYVVDSINRDVPYDRFLQEQIAGDEMIAETGASSPDPDNETHVRWMTATGFLQMAPDLTQRQDSLLDRNQVVAETLKVVSSAVLGLTVGCAQCHDHRYDPISAEDYYRFRAVFDPAFPLQDWRKPEKRVLDMTPTATRKVIEKIEAEAAEREAQLQQRRLKVAQKIYDRLVTELPEADRDALVSATAKESGKRSEEEKALLDRYPMFNSAKTIAGKLAVYDSARNKEFFEEERRIQALRNSGPPRRLVMCAGEKPDSIPESAIFSRGDPQSPKDKVQPGEIFVLARNRAVDPIPVRREAFASSGRRLAYARQLTDGSHPTVSRVAVNRIWAHHFGEGLVSTTSDFGLFGERPTHPQLLDWLADDFVRHEWRTKRLHKMIVMSHTYRQTSFRTPQADAVDPDNRLLSRMNLRRLDAEEIRDAILLVTGLLYEKLDGPSVPIAKHPDGRVVVGRRILNDGGLFQRIDEVGEEKYRRSIYLSNERISPLTMLDTFDAPVMSPNCDGRESSTVAPQSLWFLNDALILDVTDKMADRMFAEHFAGADERVRDLYVRFFSKEPTDAEMARCLKYLKLQAEQLRRYEGDDWVKLLKQHPHAADVAAHASLCQSLLSTNRFLYVE